MKSKKVLVTGGSGFLGSHVADFLEKEGYQVVLFDSTASKHKSENQKEYIGDILSYNDLYNAMNKCEIVYHFAAQADITLSSSNPSETLKSNILGTQNALEASRKHNIKRFVFASTVYVYSDLGSFYRVSKQACEKIIEEYQREYSLNYTILRYGSLYGPRANKFNFIASALLDAIKNKKIIRRGDGKEIREYIHVKDAAQLSVDILDDIYKNKNLIVTGHEQIRVKDLLLMIKEIFNNDIVLEFGHEEELHHYEITPYSYKPQVAKKITPKSYYDLGQGIMDQIYDLEMSLDSKLKSQKIGLRKRKK